MRTRKSQRSHCVERACARDRKISEMYVSSRGDYALSSKWEKKLDMRVTHLENQSNEDFSCDLIFDESWSHSWGDSSTLSATRKYQFLSGSTEFEDILSANSDPDPNRSFEFKSWADYWEYCLTN